MKQSILILSFLLCLNIAFSQTDFKQYIDSNARELSLDEHSKAKIIQNLEESMRKDLGWSDKVIKISGIILNHEYIAIEGKCETQKNEILYFRTTARSHEVLWDIDCFSDNIRHNMEKHQASIKGSAQILLNELGKFKDSLIIAYHSEFDNIIEDFEKETLELKNTNPCYEKYSFQIREIKEILINGKKEANDIVWPIDMYESELQSPNRQAAFEGIKRNSLEKENSIKTNIIKRYNKNRAELQNDIAKCAEELEAKQAFDEVIQKTIGLMKESVIFNLNKKNRRIVNQLLSNASEEQRVFYEAHLKDLNELYGSHHYTSILSDKFKVEIQQIKSETEKNQLILLWQENLKYWTNNY